MGEEVGAVVEVRVEVKVVAQADEVLFGVDEKNDAMPLVLGWDEGPMAVAVAVGDRDSHVVVDDIVVAFLHAVWLPIYSSVATLRLG